MTIAPSPEVRSVRCSQCGAAVDLPVTLRSTACSFCGSALVDAEADAAEPVDKVVPFRLARDPAAAQLKAYLAARWFAPESVRRNTRPDELRDVLVPFWAFDAIARTSFSARVGIHWYRTETYTVTVNGKTETRTRQVQETEWFPLEGSHVGQWFDQLVSASRGLNEAEANALEPFDLGEALPYAPTLVAGLTAERPTVPHAEAETTAAREIAALEQRTIASHHLPGDTHGDVRSSTESRLEPPKLVLLPVWIAVVKGPSGPIRLLVNGQSGEVVSGKIPTSWVKVAIVVGVVLAVLGLIALVVLGGGAVTALIGAAAR
ncbi:MAG: hypothetical protein ABMB14_09865 [Myxococcota bacterium]